jgi:type I restriction enzyme S subunit
MRFGWPTATIGSIATPIERAETPVPGKAYRQIGVRLWGEGVYERETIDGSNTQYAVMNRLEADDIVLNKIWARHGSVSVVQPELEGCYCSTEFPIFRPDFERLEPRWFFWMTRTKWFWSLCDAKSRGTSGKNRIRPDQFLQIEIPLPPLAEQQRIVAKIERLAGKIDEARGLRETSTHLLSRFVTSQHLQLSSETHVALGDFLALDEERVLVMPGVSYPQVGVKAYGQGLFPKPAVAANDTTYTTFNRLYSGAVLLSQVKGWEGAIAVCGDQLSGWFVSPEYRTFRCIPSAADARYLRHVFATDWFWLQLKNLTRGLGGRRERIRPEQFLELTIPMPPVEQQTKAAAVFDRLEPVRHIQGQTIAELDALLPAILDRAFKGEL